jgi:DNA-binding MarR family transcriptional regulator
VDLPGRQGEAPADVPLAAAQPQVAGDDGLLRASGDDLELLHDDPFQIVRFRSTIMIVRDRSSSVNPPVVDERLDNVLFNIWLVSRATTGLLDEALRPSGLDSDEFALYSLLAAEDGATPSELARWMVAPPTTVSSYVKRLRERGHAVQDPNPDDRRSYRLRLTEAGKAAHADAAACFAPMVEVIRAGLGKDEQRVNDALHTARDALFGAL